MEEEKIHFSGAEEAQQREVLIQKETNEIDQAAKKAPEVCFYLFFNCNF